MLETKKAGPDIQSEPANPTSRKVLSGSSLTRCLCCRRLLTDPVSVRRGYGPRCYGRLHLGRRRALVASARQRLDHLGSLLPALDGDQLEAVDSALADLLDDLDRRAVIA